MIKNTQFRLALLGASLLVLPGLAAATDSIDNVYSWGSWELGVEPAAGGPVPVTNRPLNVSQKNLQFRPNQNSAFTTGLHQMTTAGNGPTLPPVQPVAPGIVSGTPGAGPGGGDPR
jgi:hypothetical protein